MSPRAGGCVSASHGLGTTCTRLWITFALPPPERRVLGTDDNGGVVILRLKDDSNSVLKVFIGEIRGDWCAGRSACKLGPLREGRWGCRALHGSPLEAPGVVLGVPGPRAAAPGHACRADRGRLHAACPGRPQAGEAGELPAGLAGRWGAETGVACSCAAAGACCCLVQGPATGLPNPRSLRPMPAPRSRAQTRTTPWRS